MIPRMGTSFPRYTKRPKTLDHIERDLIKFIRQRTPPDKIPPTRRQLRAAKQALTIIQQV